MTMTVRAVYEGGVLRPLQPLALGEGETVEVTLASTKPAGPSPNDDEIARQIQAATSVAEWVEATKRLPSDDGGYDIVKALNENRAQSGERPLIPDERPTPCAPRSSWIPHRWGCSRTRETRRASRRVGDGSAT